MSCLNRIQTVSCAIQTYCNDLEANTKVTVYEKVENHTRYKLIEMVRNLYEEHGNHMFLNIHFQNIN